MSRIDLYVLGKKDFDGAMSRYYRYRPGLRKFKTGKSTIFGKIGIVLVIGNFRKKFK